MTESTPPQLPTLLDFTPVPRKILRRHDGWTVERQRGFIAALAETGSVSAAARAVGVSLAGAYNLYNHPEGASLRAAWDRALAIGTTRIHDVAVERALDGVPVPVFYRGEEVGTTRRYSDRVLVHLLRHHSFGHHPSPVGHKSAAAIERQAAENCPTCRERREAEAAAEPADDAMAFAAELFDRYRLKVRLERQHRLRGEIVLADFTLRQLTWLEGVLDRLGESERVLAWWNEAAGEDFAPIEPSGVGQALAELREQVWADAGDPPRPGPPPTVAESGRQGGPTWEEREAAQVMARRRIAAAQREWGGGSDGGGVGALQGARQSLAPVAEASAADDRAGARACRSTTRLCRGVEEIVRGTDADTSSNPCRLRSYLELG